MAVLVPEFPSSREVLEIPSPGTDGAMVAIADDFVSFTPAGDDSTKVKLSGLSVRLALPGVVWT